MRRNIPLTATVISLLLIAVASGTMFVNSGLANPLPPMYTDIVIEKPVNTVYNVTTIPASFSVDTDYGLNDYYYSLDGQSRKPVKVKVLVREDINAGKNPEIIRTVVEGSFVLQNLSEGLHNLTIYQISHLIGGDPDYEIPFSKSIQFQIDTTIEKYETPPIVSIHSPANGSYVNSVFLNVTITKPLGWLSIHAGESLENGLSQKLISVSCYIDGKFYESVVPNSSLASPFIYSRHLTELNDGNHTIEVHTNSTGVGKSLTSDTVYNLPISSSSATIHFALDSTPPNISFLSTKKTYANTEFPLNFIVNEPLSKISYVLDGQEHITISGNTTLTELTYGIHNIKIYATDIHGNTCASETITFTITAPEAPSTSLTTPLPSTNPSLEATPTPEPEQFPAPLAAVASLTTLTVVSASLLMYFKKRKH